MDNEEKFKIAGQSSREIPRPQPPRAWRPRVRDSTGCATCRRRRKKCDGSKPSCGPCARLGIRCGWSIDCNSLRAAVQHGQVFTTGTSFSVAEKDDGTVLDADSFFTTDYRYVVSTEDGSWHIERLPISKSASGNRPKPKIIDALSIRVAPAQRRAWAPDINALAFDNPSLMKASATSSLKDQQAKHVFKYLYERGNMIMRLSLPVIPKLAGFNIFTAGLYMATNHPGLMNALLSVAAMHLAHLFPEFRNVSVKYYLRSCQYILEELRTRQSQPPSEWLCVASSVLSLYEMSLFEKPLIRMVHFLGFHAAMEARLQHVPDGWGPAKMVLNIYTYMFATGATFHREALIGDKPIHYIDELIERLNKPPIRVLGPDIMGIPPTFISIAYKLSFLRVKNVQESPWLLEISCIAQALENWSDPELSQPHNWERRTVAQLYHLAALVLTYKLMHRSADSNDPTLQSFVAEAVSVVASYRPDKSPVINLGWPLAILCVAAVQPAHRQVLRVPIEGLVNLCGLVGFRSVLDFADRAWAPGPDGESLGLDIFFDEEALQSVHI